MGKSSFDVFSFLHVHVLVLLHLKVLHEVPRVLLHLEVQGYKENFVKAGLTHLNDILIYSTLPSS